MGLGHHMYLLSLPSLSSFPISLLFIRGLQKLKTNYIFIATAPDYAAVYPGASLMALNVVLPELLLPPLMVIVILLLKPRYHSSVLPAARLRKIDLHCVVGKWLHHKGSSVPLVGVFGGVRGIDFLLLVLLLLSLLLLLLALTSWEFFRFLF